MRNRTNRRQFLGDAAALATVAVLTSPTIARASVVVPPPSGNPATDQTNIETAMSSAASLSQGVVFPDGATYQLTRTIYIGNGSPVPAFVVGYSTTLRATSSMLNGDSIFWVTDPQNAVPRFELGGFTLDAATYPYRCLTVRGMQECNGYVHDLTLLNAQSIGLALEGNATTGGIYESYFQRIRIRNCGWVGAWLGTNVLNDYLNGGSRCQANDISGLNIEACPGGGIFCNGFQGSIRHSQIQANGNIGLYAVNSQQLDLIELYFENNPAGSSDTAVQVDAPTVVGDGCRRYGGRWNGAVVGPVTRF
jgi:hypothetical protein